MAKDGEPGDTMPQDGTRPDANERLLRGLAAAQTPRQQEIARSIYRRLNAGDSVDDVKDLITEMARVIKEERNAGADKTPGSGTAGR